MKTTSWLSVMTLILILLTSACGSSPAAVNATEVNQPGTSQASQGSEQPSNLSLPTIVAVTAAATQSDTTKSNPAPIGTGIIADDMEFVVMGKIQPANDIVAKGNMFTDTPTPDQEYMFVSLSVFCEKTSDKQCNFDTYSFKILGSDGALKDFKQVTMVTGMLQFTAFNGGTAITGYLSFLVNHNDTKLILVYQSSSGKSSYLAVPQ